MSAKPERITVNWLRRQKACREQLRLFEQVFPEGARCTVEAAEKAARAGLDVIWAFVRLVDDRGRRGFIIFTLRQQQAYLVGLFNEAGLPEHANRIAALDWSDLVRARRVLTEANDVAACTAGRSAGSAWEAAQAATSAAAAAAWCITAALTHPTPIFAWNAAYFGALCNAVAEREQWVWLLERINKGGK